MGETTTKEIDNLVNNNTKEELAEMIVSEKRRVSSYKGHLQKARADAIAYKRISESLDGESVADLKDRANTYRSNYRYWKKKADEQLNAKIQYRIMAEHATRKKQLLFWISILLGVTTIISWVVPWIY